MLAEANAPVRLRACELCRQGVCIDGTYHCVSSHVTVSRRPLPVAACRAPNGACGPEARFVDAPFAAPL